MGGEPLTLYGCGSKRVSEWEPWDAGEGMPGEVVGNE